MPLPVFAAIDGSRFADIGAELDLLGLKGRSLLLDHGDREVARAGGWLAPLPTREAIEAVVSLAGSKAAAVFWSCAGGEDVLHRHLRTLNIALVPLPANAETESGGERPQGSYKQENVLFRHCDPDALAQVLCVLSDQQVARVLGPCAEIVMFAPETGGLRALRRPSPLPIAPVGPLRLSVLQMEALQDERTHGSDARLAAYLRKVAPEHIGDRSDEQLGLIIQHTRQSAAALGVRSERGLAYWAYLTASSRGGIAKDATVADYVSNPNHPGAPDEKVQHLMTALARRSPWDTV